MRVTGIIALFAFIFLRASAFADDDHALQAQYLANAGVMVAKGDTKVLFDPFFRNDYGAYDLVPSDLEQAVLDGVPPFDGIDAVFVSHNHDDHFDAEILVAYLNRWPDVELYAPQQAVDLILNSEHSPGMDVLDRIHGLAGEQGNDSFEVHAHELIIEAIEVAHAGWPSQNTEVDNLAFRVTLDEDTTVVHMGDADKSGEHYEPHREYWEARIPRVAFAPVWLLLTEPGRYVLDEFVGADHVIGVHVYKSVPDDPANRPADFDGVDIFTRPGEIREID
jgi:L-ascorbate metabolism protein UlaG (beta-lactamase superfamily)